MIYFFLYFLAGIIIDFLFTLYVRFVAEKKAFFAALFTGINAFINFFVFYDVLSRLQGQKSIIGIACYALGIGVGTFLAMKLKLGKEKEI